MPRASGAPGEIPGGGAPGEAPETALLQAPGRRDDGSDIRHYKKGSYKTVEKRGGDRRRRNRAGPRRRTEDGSLPEIPLMRTSRAQAPGKLVSADFTSLVGLEEQKLSIYNSEAKLAESTLSVRKLVEQMELKEAKDDEA